MTGVASMLQASGRDRGAPLVVNRLILVESREIGRHLLSAAPPTIYAGEASQLAAQVSGGAAPYSHPWLPTSGLSETNIALPLACDHDL